MTRVMRDAAGLTGAYVGAWLGAAVSLVAGLGFDVVSIAIMGGALSGFVCGALYRVTLPLAAILWIVLRLVL